MTAQQHCTEPGCTRTYPHEHVHQFVGHPTWVCEHQASERSVHPTDDGRSIEQCNGWNTSGGGLGHMSRCPSWRYADA